MLLSQSDTTHKIHNQIVNSFDQNISLLKKNNILRRLGFKVFLKCFVIGTPVDNWKDMLYQLQFENELKVRHDHIFNNHVRKKIQKDLKELKIEFLYGVKDNGNYFVYTNYSCIKFRFNNLDFQFNVGDQSMIYVTESISFKLKFINGCWIEVPINS